LKSQIKQLGRHSLIFGFGDSLKGMIGFMLLPVYTRFLTPADYGQLELLRTTISVLLVIAAQGIGSAFFRSYVFIEKELNASANDLISTSYLYILLSAFAVSASLYLFSGEYNAFIFGSGTSEILVKITAVSLCFEIIMLVPYQVFRAKMESVKFITLSLVHFFLQLALNIYFVTVLRMGVKGILMGNAISSSVMVVATFLMIKKHLVLKISGGVLKDLLAFGFPLIFSSLFYWMLQMSDRFLLQKFSSTHELGLYSLGTRFASVLPMLIVFPFQKVWGAMSFQVAARDDARETFRIITTYFYLLLCFTGAGLIIWSPPVIKIIAGREFWDTHKVIFPLVCANVGSGMLLISGFGIYMLKKTKYISLFVGLSAAANIALNLTLIPVYGMMGAAYVSFASNLLLNFLCYRLSQKVYFIPFDMPRLLKISLIFLAVSVSSTLLHPSNVMADVLYRLFLTALFFGGLIISGFFEYTEIRSMKNAYGRLLEQPGFSNKFKYAYELIIGQT